MIFSTGAVIFDKYGAYVHTQRERFLIMPPEDATDEAPLAFKLHVDNSTWTMGSAPECSQAYTEALAMLSSPPYDANALRLKYQSIIDAAQAATTVTESCPIGAQLFAAANQYIQMLQTLTA